MINKEIILNADGSIKKDFSDRAIPQNSNNQVSVNVLIPSSCFTGLQNYAVLLAVSRIIGNSETTLNTLVMSVSKSITIEGVLYIKYSAILSYSYTDKIATLKFSPYIQTTATTLVEDVATEVITIQQSFTNSNLNVIKSVLPQYDASLEEGTIATTLAEQIADKKIYTFIDTDSASIGQHYYELTTGYDPTADQFNGCLVVSVYNGATTYIMPYLYNDNVELLEITKDGKFYKISNVSMDELGDTTYIYERTQLSYSKSEIDTKETNLQNQINGKVDKTFELSGHALNGASLQLHPSDVELGNVANYGVESTPTASGNELYITSKGVYDALQLVYTAISGCATDDDLTTINNRLNSIESIIGSDSGDADSVINTLKEVIVVLNGLGEGASLLDLINAKANQSDLTALNNQINGENGIKDKVDLLSERDNAYMEIKNSLGTIDILTSDWDDNDDENYPYKWELENVYLKGAVNCIVVYSKDSDTSMLSATTGIDEVNGKLVIYASELPTETISIEKIAVFNDLNSYINYSNEIVQQVLANTSAISDINNVKLPTYAKKEIIRDGYRTFVKNDNYAENGSQVVEASLQATEFQGANNFINCSVSATPVGAILRTIKVENGVATIHTLLLDTNGNLTLDGNAVGGGSTLYKHNIVLKNVNRTRYKDTVTLPPIITSDNSQMDFSALLTWLYNNGYKTSISGYNDYDQPYLTVCGVDYDSNNSTRVYYRGITYKSATEIQTLTDSGTGISSAESWDITDNVVAL